MDQVLEVSVDACFGVYSSLLLGNQVVELHDADTDRLVLLRLEHQLPHLDILDELGGDQVVQIDGLGEVPPVFAGQRAIGFVSQVLQVTVKPQLSSTYLEDGRQLLLMQHHVFQIQVYLGLVSLINGVEGVTCVQDLSPYSHECGTIKSTLSCVTLEDTVLEHLAILPSSP